MYKSDILAKPILCAVRSDEGCVNTIIPEAVIAASAIHIQLQLDPNTLSGEIDKKKNVKIPKRPPVRSVNRISSGVEINGDFELGDAMGSATGGGVSQGVEGTAEVALAEAGVDVVNEDDLFADFGKGESTQKIQSPKARYPITWESSLLAVVKLNISKRAMRRNDRAVNLRVSSRRLHILIGVNTFPTTLDSVKPPATAASNMMPALTGPKFADT